MPKGGSGERRCASLRFVLHLRQPDCCITHQHVFLYCYSSSWSKYHAATIVQQCVAAHEISRQRLPTKAAAILLTGHHGALVPRLNVRHGKQETPRAAQTRWFQQSFQILIRDIAASLKNKTNIQTTPRLYAEGMSDLFIWDIVASCTLVNIIVQQCLRD